MKKIVLITEQFPYTVDAETFLEAEVVYWGKENNINFIIMPMRLDTRLREVPKSITVDLSFAQYLEKELPKVDKTLYKILFTIRSVTSTLFFPDIFEKKTVNIQNIKELLFSLRKYYIFQRFFEHYSNKDESIVYYTYWHNEVTYALQTLKEKYPNNKVITRTHRFDLYEDTTLTNYMPLRRVFKKNIDMVFTITESANDYIAKQYGYHTDKLKTSRLGVEDYNINTLPSDIEHFYIVSCSGLRKVKQVDKIVDVIEALAKKQPQLQYKWIHIGGGELFSEIKHYADTKFNVLNNIEYDLLGSLSNQEVFEFYKNNQIDLFLNLSESEGVPVSIMEAMSCHIPIVAPNVGGISDMVVSDFNGVLLSKSPKIEEIVQALKNTLYFKDDKVRENSYIHYKEFYDANINYNRFIQEVIDEK